MFSFIKYFALSYIVQCKDFRPMVRPDPPQINIIKVKLEPIIIKPLIISTPLIPIKRNPRDNISFTIINDVLNY